MNKVERYVSALGDSAFAKSIFPILSILLFVPPIAMAVVLLAIAGERWREMPGGILWRAVVLIGGSIILSTLVMTLARWILRRQMSVAIEVEPHGFRHLRPGRARQIAWASIREIRALKRGKQPPTFKLLLEDGAYTFDPYLVADLPERRRLKFTWRGPVWLDPDGSTVPLSLDQSAGYRMLAAHRSELLERLRR